MSIARGYEPVSKLDTKIMASRQALAKMGFPLSEIDKIDWVSEERKHFEKRFKELVKLSNKGDPEFASANSASFKAHICDICGNIAGLGFIKITSPEQEKNIPSDWTPYALKRFGTSSNNNDYRSYVIIASGIVIDYQSRKAYVVCGNCRVVLGLKPTESAILIHNKTEGTGYGFVDLDRVEKLIKMYNNLKLLGNLINQ